MASINDVFNRLGVVNDSLSWIYKENVSEVAGIAQIQTSLTTLDSDLNTGFAATVNALKAIATIELAEVDLLFHLTQQAHTMICQLNQISKNTCGILTQTTIQTDLQKGIRKDIEGLLDIEESVHPESVIQLTRLAELRAQIEKCCPPTKPDPACTFQPCPAPKSIDPPNVGVVKNPTQAAAPK
jgi:hypothetical protein